MTFLKSKKFFLLLTLIYFFSLSVYAKKKDQIKSIRGKIKKEKLKLEEVQNRERSISDQLKQYDLSLEKLEKDLALEKRRLKNVDLKIKKIKQEIQKSEEEKKALDAQVSKQITSIYKYGKPQHTLNSLNFKAQQWARRDQRVYSHWFEQQYIILLKNEALIKQLQVQNIKLLEQKESKKNIVAKLLRNQKKVSVEIKGKDKLLKRVLNQKDFYQKNIDELKRAEKKMNKLLLSMQSKKSSSHFKKLKGKLPYPVDGKVFQRYGSYFDKKLNVKLYRKGMRIRAKKGKDVIAIHDGRVVYAGWFDGYGKVVILDHGDGYFSLYAHLNKIFLEQGSLVVVGDDIAQVGSTGTIYGSHLYFELRQKGLSINPHAWLEK